MFRECGSEDAAIFITNEGFGSAGADVDAEEVAHIAKSGRKRENLEGEQPKRRCTTAAGA